VADNVRQQIDYIEHPYFAVIYYLIRKRCYCSENRTMPLKTSIPTEIYSCIARYSLR